MMRVTLGAVSLLALSGCMHASGVTRTTMQQRGSTEPQVVWVVKAPDEMASSLVGPEAFGACRERLRNGDTNSCSTAIASCMALVVFDDRNELQFYGCRPSQPVMALHPLRDGLLETVPVEAVPCGDAGLH